MSILETLLLQTITEAVIKLLYGSSLEVGTVTRIFFTLRYFLVFFLPFLALRGFFVTGPACALLQVSPI